MATITGIKVGTTTITASYGGLTTTAPLEVTAKSIADSTISVTLSASSFVYTGSYQGPTVTVKDGSTTLTAGTDYTVSSFTSNINTGTYTITITGAGNYGSSRSDKSYTITAANFKDISAPDKTYVYDAAAHGNAVSAKTVDNKTTGITYKYKTSSSGTYTTTVPTFTTKGGPTTVYYQISGANHNTYEGTYTVTISARPITVTAASDSKTYDGSALTKNSATAEATGNNRGLVSGHSMTSCTVSGTITTKGSANNVPSAAVIKDASGNVVTTNYEITYANGTLTVNARAITVTATDESKTYDGSTLSASNTGSVSTSTPLPSNHTITYSCTGSIGADVSTGTKTLSSVTIKNNGGTDVTSSFTVTKNNGTLTISKRNVTYTADNQSKTYDGTALVAANTATLTSGSLVSGHTATFSCSGSQTNGGSSAKTLSTVTIKSGSTDVSSNYNITKNNGTLTVGKATLSVTESNYSGTYDATSHSSTVKVTSSGWDGKTIVYGSSTSYGSTATSNGVVNTAYAVKTATDYTASTTIYYKVSGGTNYNDYTDSVTFKIDKKSVTVTAGSTSRAYNASPLTNNTATATGQVSTHHLHSWTCTGSQTNVGSSTNVPSAAKIYSGTHNGTESDVTSNYTISYTNGTLEVTKATPTITITGVPSGTIFDGSAHYVKAATAAPYSSSTAIPGTLYWKKNAVASTTSKDGSMTLNSTSATNVTNASVTNNADDFTFYWYFVPTDTTNFNNVGGGTNDKVEAIIDPKNASTLTVTTSALTYTSAQQTFSVTVKDGSKALTVSTDYTISGNTGTNAGDYTITVTGINNYTGTKSITGTINKRNVTITPTAPSSKVYDGTALTASTATGNAIQSNDHLHSYTLGGSQTTVGESYATVSNAKIYRGSHSGTDNTDASSNYNISYANTTSKLVVTSRPITITADSGSKTYDGSALTKNSSTQSGMVSGQTYTCTVTGTITNAGTASNVPSAAKIMSGTTDVTDNYTITYNNGTLTVDARPVTFTATDQTKRYDGSTLKAANTADRTGGSALVSGHTATFTCTGETADANAGTTAVKTLSGVTIMSGSTNVTTNYNITKNNGTLSITRLNSLTKPTKVNTSNPTFTYNGSERTGINNYSQTGMTTSGTYKATNAGSYSFDATPDSNHAWTDDTTAKITLSWNIGNATNNVSYTTQDASKYCTDNATTASKTDASKTITVSSAGISSTTNKTTGSTAIGCSLVSVNGTTVPSGWSISTDGKTLTVPANTNAGEYTVKIKANAPAITNYNANSINVDVVVTLTEVVLSSIALTLNANSIIYGSSTSPKTLTATYSNSKAADVKDSATYTASPTGIVSIS